MSKFPAIPEFNDLPSVIIALRAMKDIVEQLGGLRQGSSLGAPALFLQDTAPFTTRNVVLAVGDFWVQPSGPYLSYWTGAAWRRITA